MSPCLLIVNVGSTSIKTRLFDGQLGGLAELTADYGQNKGLTVNGLAVGGGVVNYQLAQEHQTEQALPVVLATWRQWLTDRNLQLLAIGHRVVHGADWFDDLTLIDEDVLTRLAQLDHYAPLHNPFNRLGIQMAADLFPACRQFAVFDTAFHRRIPPYAGRYALPAELPTEVKFYRYGFHGLSCRHSVNISADLLGCAPDEINLIVLHLGGGCSATAIRSGVSIDTSMGFSPSEGLIMAKRPGDLDAMVIVNLLRSGMTMEQIDDLLNHHSGLQGICGDSDMRSLLAKAQRGDAPAQLALDMFCYRIKKYIGAYYAILGEVSALVFTGGIGEHAPAVRGHVVNGLESLGLSLDLTANKLTGSTNRDISASHSRSRIFVIQAEEERVCAQQILNFLGLKPE